MPVTICWIWLIAKGFFFVLLCVLPLLGVVLGWSKLVLWYFLMPCLFWYSFVPNVFKQCVHVVGTCACTICTDFPDKELYRMFL